MPYGRQLVSEEDIAAAAEARCRGFLNAFDRLIQGVTGPA
jgi:hypothetical protein